MASKPRPNLPGFAFHLTARAQDRAHRFTGPVRDRVVHFLAREVERSDARLLAYVVMTNHLHLVVVQGSLPLGRFMQPLLSSIALSVHRIHGVAGHVFERRYRHSVCLDYDYLRNAIAYTHANPVRAGLCEDPAKYRWSSHAAYVAASEGRRVKTPVAVDVAMGLTAFCVDGPATAREAGQAYLDSLASAVDPGNRGASRTPDADTPGLPDRSDDVGGRLIDGRPTLEAMADHILHGVPGDVNHIRGRWGPRARLRIRREFVLHAVRAGYTRREIGRFLALSESAVSRLLASFHPGHS